jgi:hypothetical protein
LRYFAPVAMMTARAEIRRPPSISIEYGRRSHGSFVACFAMRKSAPNFCACAKARAEAPDP